MFTVPSFEKLMSKNIGFATLFLVLFLLTLSLHAAPLKTLSVDFTRELTEKGKTEHITGTLHYDVKALRVVVQVTKPVQQIMLVKENVLEIYYPIEKQAFRFTAKGRIPLPFIESIIQSTQAEYGLTAIGYSLDKHDIVDKVLYTYWKPPEKAKEQLGTVILGMRDDKLISAEVKNPKGHIIGRSLYQDHSKIGIHYIPMTVTSSTYGPKSEVLQREKIVYSNPQVNTKPQNSILNFTIPESVKVKVVKW